MCGGRRKYGVFGMALLWMGGDEGCGGCGCRCGEGVVRVGSVCRGFVV